MIRKFEKESELSLEYVLPDYLGDVKRVLSLVPRAVLEGAFVSSDGAECAGHVDFEMTYLDTDGEVRSFIAPVDFNTDFSFDFSELRDKTASAKIQKCNHRVISARKISFKATVKLILSCDFPYVETLSLEGAECERTQVLSKMERFLQKRENEYQSTVPVPEELFGDFEILSSFGSVRIGESVIKNGIVTVSGEYVIGALIKDENGVIYSVKRSIPFEEIISSESPEGESLIDTFGAVSSINFSIDEEKKNELQLSFTSDLYTVLTENETVTVLGDAYYVDYKSDCEYESHVFSRAISRGGVDSEITLLVPVDVIDPSGAADLFLYNTDPQDVEESLNGHEVKLCGNFNLGGILAEIGEDGKRTYSPIKICLPFEKVITLDNPPPHDAKIDCEISVWDNAVTISEDGVKITLFVTVHLEIFDTGRVQMLKSIEKGEELPKTEELVYTVCYIKNDDSLFSLAKRYNTTREKLAKDNNLSLSASSTADIELPKKLIIT